MKQCPVCTCQELTPFLLRKQVPVHQNLIVNHADEARAATRGDLDLMVCSSCGFVFNQGFDSGLVEYGASYDNTQSCSLSFDHYLDDLVRNLVENQGVRNSTIVEVGCGKGHFLRKLINYPNVANQGVGFDPSYVGDESTDDGRLTFRRCYYDESCTDVTADIVVCRHVIEHVPDPVALLKSVRSALRGNPNARVFFETPCVEWILRHQVVWDFFYEHCSLFTKNSLSRAFQQAGFVVDSVSHIFGGQYLWLEARIGDAKSEQYMDREMTGLATEYALSEHELKDKWLERLSSLRSKGRVALWGAGAKGATFANLVDPDCFLIDSVVDLNPKKQGGYIPGTGHPIIAPGDLISRNVKSALLMNPNYKSENIRLLESSGIEIDLIDWN